eukprot:318367_1
MTCITKDKQVIYACVVPKGEDANELAPKIPISSGHGKVTALHVVDDYDHQVYILPSVKQVCVKKQGKKPDTATDKDFVDYFSYSWTEIKNDVTFFYELKHMMKSAHYYCGRQCDMPKRNVLVIPPEVTREKKNAYFLCYVEKKYSMRDKFYEVVEPMCHGVLAYKMKPLTEFAEWFKKIPEAFKIITEQKYSHKQQWTKNFIDLQRDFPNGEPKFDERTIMSIFHGDHPCRMYFEFQDDFYKILEKNEKLKWNVKQKQKALNEFYNEWKNSANNYTILAEIIDFPGYFDDKKKQNNVYQTVSTPLLEQTYEKWNAYRLKYGPSIGKQYDQYSYGVSSTFRVAIHHLKTNGIDIFKKYSGTFESMNDILEQAVKIPVKEPVKKDYSILFVYVIVLGMFICICYCLGLFVGFRAVKIIEGSG